MRIAGVDIPDEKRIEASLPKIFGVGPVNVRRILSEAGVDPNIRTKNLSKDGVASIQKALETIPTGGNLRQIELENIKRLKDIGCYRGHRHIQNLPVRGQRTRSNARTKRGKRKTIGAVRKDMALRMARTAKVMPKGETAK